MKTATKMKTRFFTALASACVFSTAAFGEPNQPEKETMFGEFPKPATVEELRAYAATRKDAAKTANKIAGIRRLWHDMKSENFYPEGCLTAALKTRDEWSDFDFMFFTTISGTLFTQVYGRGSDGLIDALDHRPMPHIYKEIGYSHIYIDRETITGHPDLVMEVIKAAVDKGVPVMSGGIGNVPMPGRLDEGHGCACNIGGYDEGGTLLVNVFMEDAVADEHGYCAIKDGLKGSSGLYILGEKQEAVKPADAYRKAVRSIPAFVSLPATDNAAFGQQAFYKWADAMLKDGALDLENWGVYNGPWIQLLTNEYYMRNFFDRVINASGLPEAKKAREIYMRIYAFCPDIQRLHGGDLFPSREAINRREVREEIAGILRNMGDLHNELLALFDEKNGVKNEEIPQW